MKKLDLKCPSCGAILKTKTDLDKIEAGVHPIVCEYCGYHGLLDIDENENISLNDLEEQSYAKAKGEYRARSEYEAQKSANKTHKAIFIILFLFAFIFIIFVVRKLQVIKIDPFDFAYPEFFGINGDGRAKIVYKIPDEDSKIDLNNIDYELSKEFDLIEGETIVMFAYSDKYELVSSQKNITVTGLKIQLNDLSELSAEAQRTIHEISIENLKNTYSSLEENVKSIDYEPAAMYLISDMKSSNQLNDVMKLTITFADDSVSTYYANAQYTDIVVFEDDTPLVKYDNLWLLNGSIKRVHSETDTAAYTFIYKSLAEVKAMVKEGMDGKYSELEY